MDERKNADDSRPPMWIGHVVLKVPDVSATKEFLVTLGMRVAESFDDLAILEMRAGTHLLIQRAEDPVEPGVECPFDLMVEDIEATRGNLVDAGLLPGEIESNRVHQFFLIREPGGHDILFNSSHNTGLPV
jgi:catechol 2,3-dioxygenase-like lactoylglutathione lyase family enzyme